MKTLLSLTAALLIGLSGNLHATEYKIDTAGAHAFIQFKIKHLGYSWLHGRFDDFEGRFSYDPKKPEDSDVTVVIDTASVNSNHAERDKHLRGKDFLHVEKYPQPALPIAFIPKVTGRPISKASRRYTA